MENPCEQARNWTQSRIILSANLTRMNEAAKRSRQTRFTALPHHVDVAALERAYRRLRRQAAPGVDGVTPNGLIKLLVRGAGCGKAARPDLRGGTSRDRRLYSILPQIVRAEWIAHEWRLSVDYSERRLARYAVQVQTGTPLHFLTKAAAIPRSPSTRRLRCRPRRRSRHCLTYRR